MKCNGCDLLIILCDLPFVEDDYCSENGGCASSEKPTSVSRRRTETLNYENVRQAKA